MAEIIDEANARAEFTITMAIANARINRNAVSATHCVECGELIPEARRIAVPGCTMCADCKEIAERKSKVGAA
ncbi:MULTISPECIES: TraR/DksA family transcriptional regulator [Mangrovibacter]|uniref:TraR/DksA family transcriptional regulator n=1 Tax=Mangrovibacter TaxID=451512 RepID=UPI0004D39018|nr:TraR/DksA family transcriptional regulator [Mangrovibacter sp. MFB070]KEA52747.1 conjugal transfer protein TraR [Mangrovibacter sp. MFB070]